MTFFPLPMNKLPMNETTEILAKIHTWFTDLGLKAIAALLIVLVGIRLARFLQRMASRAMQRAKIDSTLSHFTGNLVYVAVIVLTAIVALGQLGVETASFIAVLGSAGLAIGLALQGSLSNFAAGILMVIFRPFKVGDYVEVAGMGGVVEKINILSTTLTTPDNRTIIAPNRRLFDDNITNYSAQPSRRIDLVFGTKYESDIDRVKQVISEVLAKDRRILQDPAPKVGVLDWGDTGIRFAVRPWVRTMDYWDVYFDVQEAMKKRFDAEGIAVPLV
jgi:small conductance mechanosensitive channel